MIDVFIRCTPPSTTAQQKGVRFVRGRPRFYTKARLTREVVTWASLLAPHRPRVPLDGPLSLYVKLVYPHLAKTAKRDHHLTIPKTTKPDAGNAIKELEDVLTRMRFIVDDARIARLTAEKFHGPDTEVGIRIQITEFK